MQCRSCDAPIIWVLGPKHVDGSRRHLPLDANVSVGLTGNIRVTAEFGEVLTGMFLLQAHVDEEPLYTSHFATCPYTARHRTHRGAEAPV